LSPQDALNSPYIASMGVYVFKKDVLLKLLKWRYPTSNDFGSEIIPSAIKEHNVQVRGIPIKVSAYKCFYPFKELITPITEIAMKKNLLFCRHIFLEITGKILEQ
jgi:hypothetical protein